MARQVLDKERILKAATKLFSKFGYIKTTIEDIAHSLKISKGALYYYYKDKDDLFREVIEQDLNSYVEKINIPIAACTSFGEKLIAYASTRMEFFKAITNSFQTFMDDYLKNYSFIQTLRARYDTLEIDLIRNLLDQGVSCGEFAIKDTSLTAKAIFAAVKGLEYEWAANAAPDQIRNNIVVLVDLLLHGILKK